MSTASMTTVREAVLDLLRAEGVDAVFGNPGSTELTFLRDWPNDMRYVLGLQEASVVAMADGYAQGTGRTAFVNLHSAAGVGHALGNLFTAFHNGTPLVVTAGQQARSLLPRAPYLFAERATEFPRPYVKWAAEPARAEDVPDAVAHAFAVARTPPFGPAFVSVPVDDWPRPCAPVAPRRICAAARPDPDALRALAEALAGAQRPVLVMGPEVDRDGGWPAGVALAERLRAPVFSSPNSHRASFPEDHPLFAGFAPAAPGPLSEVLGGFDVVAVFGAPVFTFHAEGRCTLFEPGGPAVWQVTADPEAAAGAGAGTSIVGAVRPVLEALRDAVPASAMYSIQALHAAAQGRLPLTVVVLNNGGYGAMRAFSRAMGLGGAPGINIRGLDFPALAAGHGCAGVRVDTADAFVDALAQALQADGRTLGDRRGRGPLVRRAVPGQAGKVTGSRGPGTPNAPFPDPSTTTFGPASIA